MNTEAIMRAVVLFFFIFATTNNAVAAECDCSGTDFGFHYITVNPDDIDYMEDFLWEIIDCRPITEVSDTGEVFDTLQVRVNLVSEDNPHLETLTVDADGNEKVLIGDEWVRFDEFEMNRATSLCHTVG
jgi:hypothetical protein